MITQFLLLHSREDILSKTNDTNLIIKQLDSHELLPIFIDGFFMHSDTRIFTGAFGIIPVLLKRPLH